MKDVPLTTEALEYREYVTALTTTTELEDEGSKMNHCVGGYALVLTSNQGYTKIYHIDGARTATGVIYIEEKAQK